MDADESPSKHPPKKRRSRTRTRNTRKELQTMLDKTLSNRKSAVFALLANAQNGSTDDYVPLRHVLMILELEDRAKQLSRLALSSLGENSPVFEVSADGQGIRLKRDPPDKDECTVYLDKLPPKTNAASLEKWASAFGTVVDVQLPPPAGGVNGRSNKGFAFVRFARKGSVLAICQAFKSNFSSTVVTSVVESEKAAPTTSSTAPAEEAAPPVSSSSDRPPDSTSLAATEGQEAGSSKNEKKSVAVQNTKKRKRRKRFKNHSRHPIDPEMHKLNKLFIHAQALPLSTYKSLRAEYLSLQKANMGELKKKLRESGAPAVKKRRMRGRDKLISRAYDERLNQELKKADQSAD